MTGIHELKITNSATVPDVALPPPSLESCVVAKLANIPDINCVSRLAFGNFYSHGCSPRLIQRFLKTLLSVVRKIFFAAQSALKISVRLFWCLYSVVA
jgi:hypothetical protein